MSLSPETLTKAVSELNEPEDSNKRLAAIRSLQTAFKTKNPDLALIRDDDQFALRFLRAKKYDQAKALLCMTNYHEQRLDWPEVFDKVNNPALIKSVADKGVVCPLEGKAKDGSVVIVLRPGLESCTDITELFSLLYLTIDKLLEYDENQIHGVTIINDLAYFSSEIAAQFSPSTIMKFAKTMQECVPLRIKSLNITNEPKIFGAVFTLIQPFLKEKLKKRLLVHGKDFKNLYNIVDKSVLPHMFAGSGPEPNFEFWKNNIFHEGTAL